MFQNPSSTSNVARDVKELINGQVRFNEGEGNYVVDLFRTANLSTLAHEMGHVYFLEMQGAVENGLADEPMQKGYGNLCAYAELNKTKDSNGIINLAVSVFAKNSEDTGEPYSKWFYDNADKIIYIDKEKENRWHQSVIKRTESASGKRQHPVHRQALGASGSNSFWSLVNATGKKIYTRRDLVDKKMRTRLSIRKQNRT